MKSKNLKKLVVRTRQTGPISAGNAVKHMKSANAQQKGTICKYCTKPDHWLKVCWKRLSKINAVEDSASNESQGEQSAESDGEVMHIKNTEPIE